MKAAKCSVEIYTDEVVYQFDGIVDKLEPYQIQASTNHFLEPLKGPGKVIVLPTSEIYLTETDKYVGYDRAIKALIDLMIQIENCDVPVEINAGDAKKVIDDHYYNLKIA